MKKMYVVLFAVNRNREKKNILEYVAKFFGGYSLTTMQGGWHDKNTDKVIEETSYKLELITDREMDVFNLCEFIKDVANQSEVYYYELDVKIKVG